MVFDFYYMLLERGWSGILYSANDDPFQALIMHVLFIIDIFLQLKS